MILPKELLKKVKQLEMTTKKLVNNQLVGEYHSAFKGQGMTFSDFREYVPGDDVRNISWQLMARTGKVYIKQYEEERELTIFLVLDVSGSTDFGTGGLSKGEVLTQLSALLAFSAVRNNDRVGLILFSDQVEHYVPAKKGRGHVLRVLRDIYFVRPKSHRTKISAVCDFLLNAQKKRAVVFVMSDFMDSEYEENLRQIGRRHDVVACVVEDPFESQPFSLGLVEVQDPETGEMRVVDMSSRLFQKEYQKIRSQMIQERDLALRKAQVDRVDIPVSSQFADALVEYLRRRKRAR